MKLLIIDLIAFRGRKGVSEGMVWRLGIGDRLVNWFGFGGKSWFVGFRVCWRLEFVGLLWVCVGLGSWFDVVRRRRY